MVKEGLQTRGKFKIESWPFKHTAFAWCKYVCMRSEVHLDAQQSRPVKCLDMRRDFPEACLFWIRPSPKDLTPTVDNR